MAVQMATSDSYVKTNLVDYWKINKNDLMKYKMI